MPPRAKNCAPPNYKLGHKESSVVEFAPLLEQLDADDDIQRRVAFFDLAEAGQEAVQPLVAALADVRPRVRSGAALALGKLGATAAAAVPSLITTLGGAVEHVRRCGRDALCQIGETVEPQLVQALESSDANTQAMAAAALGRIGKPAAVTIARLLTLLIHESAFVRRQAAHAFGQFGNDSVSPVLELLRKALQARDWSVAEEAVVAPRETGSKTDEVYSALFHAFWSGGGRVRDEALTALRVIDSRLEIRQNQESVTLHLPGRIAADWMRQHLQQPPDS